MTPFYCTVPTPFLYASFLVLSTRAFFLFLSPVLILCQYNYGRRWWISLFQWFFWAAKPWDSYLKSKTSSDPKPGRKDALDVLSSYSWDLPSVSLWSSYNATDWTRIFSKVRFLFNSLLEGLLLLAEIHFFSCFFGVCLDGGSVCRIKCSSPFSFQPFTLSLNIHMQIL